MFWKNKYKNSNEPLLEPIFRELRFGVAKNDLTKVLTEKSVILDYGCGPEAKFYHYLVDKKIPFGLYIGYDPLSKIKKLGPKGIIATNMETVRERKYDLISLFAVLEHLPYPAFDYGKLIALLESKGHLILTTPTKMAKPVLEFLSYKIGIVSRREIEEHQHYFDLKEIELVFKRYDIKALSKKIFEVRMNNYALLKKNDTNI